jgi:hypothetical protein
MEPTPPELGAATGSPRELIVESREELLYLLGEAAELEHSVPADAGPATASCSGGHAQAAARIR